MFAFYAGVALYAGFALFTGFAAGMACMFGLMFVIGCDDKNTYRSYTVIDPDSPYIQLLAMKSKTKAELRVAAE